MKTKSKSVVQLREEADELMALSYSQRNAEGDPLTEEQLQGLLSKWLDESENKLLACRQVIASCEARRISYEHEIEGFAILVERENKAIERVNDYSLLLLQTELELVNASKDAGEVVDRVKLPDGAWAKLYVGKGRLVNIRNFDMLPKEFIYSRADKAAIRDAIRAGIQVAGAEIIETAKPPRVQWGGRKRQ